MAGEKKVYKLKKAFKSAARLPARVRVSGGRGSGRNTMDPVPGELPVVLLRVQVLACNDLLAKDKSGTSDPFVVVSLARNRHTTPVVKKTLNPVYNSKDATFDFPIYLSLAGKLGVLELVVWDKDMLKKDYLGEASLQLENWFKDRTVKDFDDLTNVPSTVNIISTRASTSASGSIQVKLGFLLPENVNHSMSFDEIYEELLRRAREAHMSLVSAPPTEGIGTIRAHGAIPAYEDDGLSSDEGSSDEEDEEENGLPIPLSEPSTPASLVTTIRSPSVPGLNIVAPSPTSPTTVAPLSASLSAAESPTTPTAKPSKGGKLPRVFRKRPSLVRAASADSSRTRGARVAEDFNFNAANDILGIVLLDIQGATDLPKLKNMTRTGWDMDPFVVISFGKKVFRTRVIRHSLNPVWDEKLLFHVRRYETNFKVQLTVLDWDKLSSNDHVGDASFDLSELLKDAPKKSETTNLYPESAARSTNEMQEFKLHLSTAKEVPWEAKHNPVLTVRAKFQPYDALRQQFWRQYLKQYDTDDIGSISRIELTSMLDSLGSTLSNETIDGFFMRRGKNPKEDELTMDEAIQSLEMELCRHTSAPATPMMGSATGSAASTSGLALENMDFSGPHVHPTAVQADSLSEEPQPQETLAAYPTEPSQQPLMNAAQSMIDAASTRVPAGYHAASTSSSSSEADESSGTNTEDSFERVINVKNCPLCHRPRINKRAEVDIVTHLAVCASQDWARVDRIVVGNFVTASQAQRKWYTKVISKVSSGNYKLGANSANIIVQNRMTGQLEEEKMQVYVRLGIRLLYKGAKGRMEGARARRLLKSLSIKQGIKYDSPESVNDIPAFVQFHKLKVDEILEPINSFKTFNQFFYRKLKPDARPVEAPGDPTRLVSAADCRMMAFESVNEATRLWIKGREFTVARLLGEAYRGEADKYIGGALCVFRLAPQDYHRFHSPVDGKIGPMTYISGEYYTVNPQAVRTTLDVYGENARKIVPIDSPTFGRVMAVCVGAMMVGSIQTTVQENEEVKRGQEFGYFAFGGSTIVCLFEKGMVEWDEDLVINGRASLETLVQVGMGIGRARRPLVPSASSSSKSRSPAISSNSLTTH
ncbi:phosphatidylserine decarboxylase-domain-containing protein [Phellopilus nigrolimitatus]|nr:phosphatidylserine decarboxylase-domain-containing protein [Phellopilus nigrolimitatus]